MGKSYGQVAYEAYCARTDGKSYYTGQDLPAFEIQPLVVQEAWEAAGQAAADAHTCTE